MTPYTPLPHIKDAEARLTAAVASYIPELGLNRLSLDAGSRSLGLSDGMRDLIAPNGAADIAASLWRSQDEIFLSPETAIDASGLKIRDKIAYLLNLRLDEMAKTAPLATSLMGFFALPVNALLYHRLLWQTADHVWRLAGDTALDENHYSKRIIVCGIVTTAIMTRLSQGQDAQRDQIARNIGQVMAFEKFKARLPFDPQDVLLKLAGSLGRVRFGSEASRAGLHEA